MGNNNRKIKTENTIGKLKSENTNQRMQIGIMQGGGYKSEKDLIRKFKSENTNREYKSGPIIRKIQIGNTIRKYVSGSTNRKQRKSEDAHRKTQPGTYKSKKRKREM